MDTCSDPADTLIADLVGFGDIKVWSMLVTILGDLAPERGQGLTGPVLSALTGRMGIRPEAQRVALHRLRKDGWITARKGGRISRYALSDLGRAETATARGRVFGPRVARPERCTFLAFAPGEAVASIEGFVAVAPNMMVGDRPIAAIRGAVQSEPAIDTLPAWVRDAVMPDHVAASYRALLDLLVANRATRAGMSRDDGLIVRLLVLHRWRRLVLGHTRSAANLMGRDWVGDACRTEVHGWLDGLWRPMPDALQDHLSRRA